MFIDNAKFSGQQKYGCMYLIRMRIKSDRVLGDTMDRTYWVDSGDLLLGETVVSQQSGLRLYDGEDRVTERQLLWPVF